MKVINTIKEMQRWSKNQRQRGKTIGLVPTMGFLHEGHLSLVRKAKEQSDLVVVSIYVNPTQFGPDEDLDQYPCDFEKDQKLCEQEGVDVIFYPFNDEMYQENHKTYVITEDLSKIMCGVSRPTHFKGVTTIVAKLFNIVQPDLAVFGQKDAQQAIIIKRMVADLNFDVQIIISPIERESDGLAMSSRNKYLNEKERIQATVLFHSLQLAKAEFEKGNNRINDVKQKMKSLIEQESNGRIDYIEFVGPEILSDPDPDKGNILIALAVYFSKTRLIDNMIIEKKELNIGP